MIENGVRGEVLLVEAVDRVDLVEGGMWRLRFQGGLTVWFELDEKHAPRAGDTLGVYRNGEDVTVWFPIGRTQYPFRFKLGRFAVQL